MENLLSAEGGGELADALERKGVLVVNGSNKYCLDLYKKFPGKKRLYSTQKEVIEGDLWTEDITVTENSISFITVSKKGVLQPFSVRVLGRQQVQNLLAAILVARELGMSFEKISEACKKIDQEQGGMTLTKGAHGIWVVDASYSSNPDGVVADLDYLSVFSGNPSTSLGVKKVIVMPCLIELGKDAKAVHRALGKKIATVCDLAIITTKDYFEDVKEGAILEGMPAERILLCPDGEAIEDPRMPIKIGIGTTKSRELIDNAFATITTFLKSGDVVLLEGRVPETVIKKLKHV
jgi:UDP-N-acetylmuramoyl-tripeptide--D-alanyl-D-alanine ligase